MKIQVRTFLAKGTVWANLLRWEGVQFSEEKDGVGSKTSDRLGPHHGGLCVT